MPTTRGGLRTHRRPRRAGRAGSTSEIHERGVTRGVERIFRCRSLRQRSNNFANEEKVQRSVEQREGRALPCAIERSALAQPLTTLDVG